MNIYKELMLLSENPKNEKLLKRYFLECCEKLVKYRSRGALSKGIDVAKLHIKGRKALKKLCDIEWRLEGEAFEIDHFIVGINTYPKLQPETRKDLVKVRLNYRLTNRESLLFLRDMAYFIDSVFVYISFPINGIPKEQYKNFMCSRLFKKYFG